MAETLVLIVFDDTDVGERKARPGKRNFKVVIDGSTLSLREVESNGREHEIVRLPSLGSRERNLMAGLLTALVYRRRVWPRLYPGIFGSDARTGEETLFGSSLLDALLTTIVVERFRPAPIAGPATVRLLNELAYRIGRVWMENGQSVETPVLDGTGAEKALLQLYSLYAGTVGEEDTRRELDRLTAEILHKTYSDVFTKLVPDEIARTVKIWDVVLMDTVLSVFLEPDYTRTLFGRDVRIVKTEKTHKLVLTLRNQNGQFITRIEEDFTVFGLISFLLKAGLNSLENMEKYVKYAGTGAVLLEARRFLLSFLHKKRKISLDKHTGKTFIHAQPGKLSLCLVEDGKCWAFLKHEKLREENEIKRIGSPLVYEPEIIERLGEDFFDRPEHFRFAVQTGRLLFEDAEPINERLAMFKKDGKWTAILRTRDGNNMCKHGETRTEVLVQLLTYLLDSQYCEDDCLKNIEKHIGNLQDARKYIEVIRSKHKNKIKLAMTPDKRKIEIKSVRDGKTINDISIEFTDNTIKLRTDTAMDLFFPR